MPWNLWALRIAGQRTSRLRLSSCIAAIVGTKDSGIRYRAASAIAAPHLILDVVRVMSWFWSLAFESGFWLSLPSRCFSHRQIPSALGDVGNAAVHCRPSACDRVRRLRWFPAPAMRGQRHLLKRTSGPISPNADGSGSCDHHEK